MTKVQDRMFGIVAGFILWFIVWIALLPFAVLIGLMLQAHAQSPQLYGADGRYLGSVNTNRYDPYSVANPYGQYGNPYMPNSINNPYGVYGSPYSSYSVRNPYAR